MVSLVCLLCFTEARDADDDGVDDANDLDDDNDGIPDIDDPDDGIPDTGETDDDDLSIINTPFQRMMTG